MVKREPFDNMAANSRNTPPEPEVFGSYFQIPEEAEVKRVPVSMLSSSVQEKIARLGSSTDTPYVVVVSPITMQKIPSSHKARKTMAKTAAKHQQRTSSDKSQPSDRRSSMRRAGTRTREEQKSYLVPVKCFKDIALAILQLSQTYNQDALSPESELRALSDSLNVNQQAIIKMEAAALYMCKNVMYLLPQAKKAEIKDEKCEAWDRVVKSEVTTSQLQVLNFKCEESEQTIVPKISDLKMEELNGNSEGRSDDLGCVSLRRSSFLQRQNRGPESGATVVTLWGQDLSPAKDSPSSRPSTEGEQQISFWEQSGPSKRKLFSIGNEEPSIKKICQNDSESESVPASSPLWPEASFPLDPQESLPSFSDANSPDLEEFLSPSPRASPAPSGSHPTCGDNTSPPHLEAKSSPSEASFLLDPPVSLSSFSEANSPDIEEFLSPSPRASPAPSGSHPTCGDNTSPSHLEAKSSPSQAFFLLDPQESSSSFTEANSPELEEFFSPSPRSSPAPSGSLPTCGDNTSPPHLETKSSPSEASTSSAPGDPASLNDTLPISKYLGSRRTSLLDIDDTTRDEKTQKLLARVRECNQIIEDMRQKEDGSESILEI